MGNNTPDYKDNLYFEPQPTWEDVVKVAKKYGYEEVKDSKGNVEYLITNKWVSFTIYPNGYIFDEGCDNYYNPKPRSYSQLINFLNAVYE